MNTSAIPEPSAGRTGGIPHPRDDGMGVMRNGAQRRAESWRSNRRFCAPLRSAQHAMRGTNPADVVEDGQLAGSVMAVAGPHHAPHTNPLSHSHKILVFVVPAPVSPGWNRRFGGDETRLVSVGDAIHPIPFRRILAHLNHRAPHQQRQQRTQIATVRGCADQSANRCCPSLAARKTG